MIIDENFQTPKSVCDYMVSMVPLKAKTIFEPTPGLGNLVNSLKNKNQFKIDTADDFFLFDLNKKYDCIVMNPPFSSKSAFLDNAPKNLDLNGMKLGYYILNECMKMSDNIIALMPWFTISYSDVRLRHFKNFGLKSLTALPRKTFNYARIQTVVLELEKEYKGETIFKIFNF